MRIVVDMQGLQTPFSGQRGVGRYVKSVAIALSETFPHFNFQYVFNAAFAGEMDRCRSQLNGLLTRQNTSVFHHLNYQGWQYSSPAQIRIAHELWASYISSLQPDLFFCPNLQEGLADGAVTGAIAGGERFCQVSTLHDLVPFHYEEYHADGMVKRWYSSKIRDAIDSDLIATVSSNSRSEIIKLLAVSPEQVVAAPNGFDASLFHPVDRAETDPQLLKSVVGDVTDYMLYLGGSDPHKNLGRLIDAYALLPEDVRGRWPLIIAGSGPAKSGEVAAQIEDQELRESVSLVGFVNDETAAALMRHAVLFIVPSTHEGFGLPALEAMACGAPTIGSASSAVAEVIGRTDALFDPYDIRSMAALMQRAISDRSFNQSLRETGLERASTFSWARTAFTLGEAFESAVDRKLSEDRISFLARRLKARQLTNLAEWSASDMARDIARSCPAAREKTIFLDLSSVATHGGNTGIQRVARAIAATLPEATRSFGFQVVAVAWDELAGGFRSLDDSQQFSRSTGDVVDFAQDDDFVFLDLHPGVAIDTQEEMQRLRMIGVRTCHVVYDILPVLMPDKFWPDLCSQFRDWLNAISRADRLICISDTVAKQCAEYLEKFAPKRSTELEIDSFRLGSDIRRFAATSEELDKSLPAMVSGDYFLLVSTLEPRKSHMQTLSAFEHLWRNDSDLGLVFVGKAGWSVEELTERILRHPQLGRKLHWFQDLSDAELDDLYAGALCVIAPSVGEGFGLSLVEASAHGVPVIARDIPVFREVAGDGAFYFEDSPQPEKIVEAIETWLTLRDVNALPDGRKIRPISWQDSATLFAEALLKRDPAYRVRPRGLYLPGTNLLATPSARLLGFYDREPDLQWTTAAAAVEFELAQGLDDAILTIELNSWRATQCTIKLDGQVLWGGKINTSVRRLELPVGTLEAGARKVGISADADSPGKKDRRILGVGIRTICISSGRVT